MSALLKANASLKRNTESHVGLNSVAISPNNKHIVIPSRSNLDDRVDIATLYDIESCAIIREFKHTSHISAFKFSRDGKHLYTGSRCGIFNIWNLLDNNDSDPIQSINEHSFVINCIDVSPNNKYVVTGSGDRSCRLFELDKIQSDHVSSNNFSSIRTLQHTSGVYAVQFTKGTKCIIAGTGTSYQKIVVWDVAGGTKLRTLDGHTGSVYCFATSVDSKYVVSSSDDGTAIMWSLETCDIIQKYDDHNNPVMGVAMSSDNSVIITSYWDNIIKIWDAKSSSVIGTLSEHTDGVNSIVLSSNDQYLASASFDGTSKLWDMTPVFCERSWETVQSVVMLRWLSERQRTALLSKGGALDLLVLDANDDVFCYALSFIIHPLAMKS